MPRLTEPLQVQPLTIGLLMGIVALVSFGIGGGIWAGGLQAIVSQNRAANHVQEQRLSRLEEMSSEMRSQLASINAQLTFLVRRAQSGNDL